MIINDNILTDKERSVLKLKELYSSYGYSFFRMNKFEEYDFYVQNKDFLVSDNVITFTDTNGRLMALKPDVTLSIVKACGDIEEKVNKLFYNENVYRVSKGSGTYKEVMQTGLECIGKTSRKDTLEVIELAVKSLKLLCEKPVLVLSDLAITEAVIAGSKLKKNAASELIKALESKNSDKIASLSGAGDAARLLDISGDLDTSLPKIKSFAEKYKSACKNFIAVLEALQAKDLSEFIRIDFSMTADLNYYNGTVFKGFIPGISEAVLSGGQYDRLIDKLGKKGKAIGFAVYTDLLERSENSEKQDDDCINIALPKGRLGENVYRLFEKAGYDCPDIKEDNRKLVFENRNKRIRFFWVKPSDVAIYVERGAADIGVAGKDILVEYSPDIFELADLGVGKCRMSVSGPKTFTDTNLGVLRVATKFKNTAMSYYSKKSRDIDIIELNGSIEIAPILGLSDVIVDIVETGKTLKENDLVEIEKIFDISARLIANKSSYMFKAAGITQIADKLSAVAKEK